MAVTILRTVRPSPEWQDTLIRIQSGQRLVIDTEEVWSPDMRNQVVWCGADGVYNHAATAGYLLPGTNVGALIGRIDSGTIFAIGSRFDRFIEQQGVLYLAMNENPNHNNQAGKLTAQVILFDA